MSVNLLLFLTASLTTYYVANATPFPITGGNMCAAPCAAACSPACLPSCCAGGKAPCAPAKQEFVIGSVEEGDTEECTDKGFKSPTDDSEDPPGTITIPLPPTMYTPPKPGEEAKELPLPDFKLPASILNGVPPSKSMTLTPEVISSPNSVSATTPTFLPNDKAAAPVAAAAPVLAAPPSPPPPAPVASGYSLQYPKLPPVTISEIPGRANRLPPLPGRPQARPIAPISVQQNAINLPRPPPIHLSLGAPAGGNSVLGPSVSAVGVAPTCAGAPCAAKAPGTHIDPVAREMELELNSRYGGK